MSMLLSLAWRNIWRNRRRSLITILAVVFAVLLSILMQGIQAGTFGHSIMFALQLFSGGMQVQPTGWHDNPTLQKTLVWDASLAARIRSTPGVTGAAPRIAADGLICFRDKSYGCAVHGMDPAAEKGVTILDRRIREGAYLSPDDGAGIVLGRTLLENLGARIGDTLVLLSQGFDGSLGNVKLHVRGVIRAGSPGTDAHAVYVPLATLQDMLGMEGRVNYVAIATASIDDIPDVRAALVTRIGSADRTVLTWEDLQPEMRQMMELKGASAALFIGILLIIVTFGILNTVLMSITERFREFGMLLALGMPQRLLVLTVLVETLLITCIGLAAGDLLAWGLVSYMQANPIHVGGSLQSMYEEFGFAPEIHTLASFGILMRTTVAVFSISLLVSVWPLMRVWKLEPLGGIRFT